MCHVPASTKISGIVDAQELHGHSGHRFTLKMKDVPPQLLSVLLHIPYFINDYLEDHIVEDASGDVRCKRRVELVDKICVRNVKEFEMISPTPQENDIELIDHECHIIGDMGCQQDIASSVFEHDCQDAWQVTKELRSSLVSLLPQLTRLR